VDKSVESLKSWALEHVRWYGQSAFGIRTDGGKSLFIDPFRVPANAGPADLILVTHPHQDHYDRNAIQGLRTRDTAIVMPRSCAEPGQVALSAGESTRVGSFAVTGIAAHNVSKRFHPKASGWLGYVVELDGLRIYHAGDTDVIGDMKDLRPDIALLPVGGLFAMNGRAAVEAAGILKASLCIPMHFGMLLGGRGAGARFVRMLGAGGLVLPRA
jgi:L-ascorbate metabolism protein UlaG (beta-lactamase superfamily)